MPSEVLAHYEKLLASHYTWMATGGDYQAGVRESIAVLSGLNLAAPTPHASALDLGCGPGMQSAALLALGYRTVAAVDPCETLIDELRRSNAPAVAESRLQPRVGDLLDPAILPAGASLDLVVCLGDTLTHLPARDELPPLFARAHAAIADGGRIALRFRDLTQALTGTDRFISVRADPDKIMTCFLEDAGPEYVGVTDLISARRADGWQFEKSAYRKLRLATADVAAWLRKAGFAPEHESRGSAGLTTLVGRRL